MPLVRIPGRPFDALVGHGRPRGRSYFRGPPSAVRSSLPSCLVHIPGSSKGLRGKIPRT